MYICAKGVNFAFVSTILDWIMKLSLQCGIFLFYYSICLFLSSSYSDFYCNLIFAVLHMLSIRYPLLFYYASVYRGSVLDERFISLFQFKLVLLFISTTKCVIYSTCSPFRSLLIHI